MMVVVVGGGGGVKKIFFFLIAIRMSGTDLTDLRVPLPCTSQRANLRTYHLTWVHTNQKKKKKKKECARHINKQTNRQTLKTDKQTD